MIMSLNIKLHGFMNRRLLRINSAQILIEYNDYMYNNLKRIYCKLCFLTSYILMPIYLFTKPTLIEFYLFR